MMQSHTHTINNSRSDSLLCRILYSKGPIFDIKTKSKNVKIAGFDLNCNVPDGIESKVFVYSLPGGRYYDNGSWYKKQLWDLVHESSISCNGFGTPTPVTLAESVTVPKESVCFNISMSVIF